MRRLPMQAVVEYEPVQQQLLICGKGTRLVEGDIYLFSTVAVAVQEGLQLCRPSCRSRDIGLGAQELSDSEMVLRVSSHGPTVAV